MIVRDRLALDNLTVDVDIATQVMTLSLSGQPWLCYRVSTALNGPGEQSGSGCTPRGVHRVRACIGHDLPVGTVFVGRRPTGEIHSAALVNQFPQRDWILTRILWLSGCERGVNRLGSVDSMRRYIYIHGTSDTEPMGEPRSHGCVRMRNRDIVQLFDWVLPGTPVFIH